MQDGPAGVLTHGLGPVYDLAGNIDAVPAFADADFRLGPTSPCVNIGTNKAWMMAETDLDGAARIGGGTVDLGAYEAGTNGAASGSLRCIIEPAAVLPLGAQWRLLDGASTNWNDSGVTIFNLAAGSHTVVFKDIPSWDAPAQVSVDVVSGVDTAIKGVYSPVVQDILPPVIAYVLPPDGYVTTSSHIRVSVVATDNVAVAKVTVNKREAAYEGSNTWVSTVHGVRGAYNAVKVVAYDTSGNETSLDVNYARDHGVKLHAVYAGYWRIRNPFNVSYSYVWSAVETSETGSGIIEPHSDVFFSTSLDARNVNLYITGVLVDTAKASDAEVPRGEVNEQLVDSDGDGLNNMVEAIADTDPFAEDSTFVVRVGAPAAAPLASLSPPPSSIGTSGFALNWATSADNYYTVETSLNLTDWAPVPGYVDVRGTGGDMGYTNCTPSSLFFRIKTRPVEATP